MAKPEPMETIHETYSGPKTPAMAGLVAEALMFTVEPKKKDVQKMAIGQPGRSVSVRASVTKKTSLRIRNWVKRSNSSGEIAPRSADTAPSVSWPKITHLGGGRVEDAPITGARATQRSRATSADSRRTQWLDFYSQDLECSRLPTKPLSRHPSLTRLRPPDKDVDLHPLPLRVPSLERKDESPNTLTRKSSKWKALPGLPTQNQTACMHVSTESADVERLIGMIMLDTPSLPAALVVPHIAAAQQRESETGSILPNAMYMANTVTGLGAPPKTPDSASGSTAMTVIITRPTAGSIIQPFPARKDSLPCAHPPSHFRIVSESWVLTPVSPDDSTTSSAIAGRYTHQERMWLHRNYRGEAPFLAAWGLDITSQQDRDEGVGIVKELMMEEIRKGQNLSHS
ncbi:hypothetical protein QBC36DRAFT_244055 [Triangularia setosa]|uniref:Uncharacterized protein n=1 Tax=Triangularia setosa TaxID=2587417 RepID=A0AAN6W4J1_9PEZI|nr:hypothetical protein QBC36DRAFT_244055 [Podospora setosa]